MLRRLLKHHSEIFNRSNTAPLIAKVLLWASSLRSSLAKNSIIVINDIFNEVPKLIEPELDSISGLLIKRSADTNSFIAEEA